MNTQIKEINLLIIDTETTGLYPEKGALCIEVGALLYNVTHKKVLQTFSTFLPCDSNPVENINNIKAVWTRCEMAKEMPFRFLNEMASYSHFIVAHNADFDRKFLATIPALMGKHLFNTRWLCTRDGFPWPVSLPRKRLQDVCEAMKVPYVDAHRALTDIASSWQTAFPKVKICSNDLKNYNLTIRINYAKQRCAFTIHRD